MRKRFEPQIVLGQTPIENVVLPAKSRDEVPAVLAGLQWIYQTPELNGAVFQLLEERIVGDKKDTGRPGMDLWHILVLGVVRLARGCDYDQLEHTANFDSLVRQIMGIATGFGAQNEPLFHHKTLSGNVCHIDEELLEKINALIVEHGQPAAATVSFLGFLAAAQAEPLPEFASAFITKHCVDCHDADTARAGFRIDLLTADFTAGNNAGLWHEVMNKINSGEMPPEKKPRPDAQEAFTVASWVAQRLDETTKAAQGGGRGRARAGVCRCAG